MKTLILSAALLAVASTAMAQQPPTGPTSPDSTLAVTTQTKVQDTPAAKPQPLALDELSTLSARQGTTVAILSDQDLTAVSNGNTITADSVASGDISIGASAFAGFAGVGNFVINSGQNNNLQGAMTINIVSP